MRLLKEWRILLLLVALLLAIVAIGPSTGEGLQITYIEFNSSAWDTDLKSEMIITEVNSIPVRTPKEFYEQANKTPQGQIITIKADGKEYSIFMKGPLGIEVQEAPSSNIRLGLDLQGGTRVLVSPLTDTPSKNVTEATKEVLSARMNTYGLRDVKVRTVEDIEGNNYIQFEMAGPGSERILKVINTVGRFEVRLRNKTIFTGEDVATVGAVAAQREGGYGVPFTVNRDAAESLQKAYTSAAMHNATSCVTSADCPQYYTCSPAENICRPLIEMFLDDDPKFSAPANLGLHNRWMAGMPEQEMVVQVGSPEAAKAIEVVMRSGTLPAGVTGVKVVSKDYVDATLGRDFIHSTVVAAVAALLAVALFIFIRYRDIKISSAILFTGFSEVLLLLGAAAFLRQDLDLPSIAGIIAAIGTGVDQQIIMTDEITGKYAIEKSLLQKLKTAFFIVFVAAGTTMATMFPLMTIGIGMVKGFAIMTFLGSLFGFTITRPAYGRLISYFAKG